MIFAIKILLFYPGLINLTHAYKQVSTINQINFIEKTQCAMLGIVPVIKISHSKNMLNTLKDGFLQTPPLQTLWALLSLSQIILFLMLATNKNDNAAIAFFLFCTSLVFLSPDYVAMSERRETLKTISILFMLIAFFVFYKLLWLF